jgi:hypothetical protein
MARLKKDGEFQIEGTVRMWLPLQPEEGERLRINPAQEILPEQVWVHVNRDGAEWVVETFSVKGRLYRQDGVLGSRRAERLYSGPANDADFEGPDWLVDILSRDVPWQLFGMAAVDALLTTVRMPDQFKDYDPQEGLARIRAKAAELAEKED